MKCETNKIYIPWANKCMNIQSKNAIKLNKLIKICNSFEDYDPKCKDINKIYKTNFVKLQNFLKKSLIPVISIGAFNLLIFLSLTNENIRRKILRFALNNINRTAPYAFILEPLILLIPTFINFIERYQNLFRLALNGLTPAIIIGLIHDFINHLYRTRNININIQENADILANNLLNIPGNWQTIDNNQNPLNIDLRVQVQHINHQINQNINENLNNNWNYIDYLLLFLM